MGKFGLMVGTATIAMFTASGASAAVQSGQGATTVVSQPSGQIQLAQADMPPSNADLEARISALEAEVQDSQVRAAEAANAAPPPPPCRLVEQYVDLRPHVFRSDEHQQPCE